MMLLILVVKFISLILKKLSIDYVKNIITRSAKTSCLLDPMQCADELLPVITSMINLSLQSGCLAEQWKEALLHPMLKKCGLDCKFNNLRPVSNLSFISKLTESAAANQLQSHMSANSLYPPLQSSYRKQHSTETALIKVHNDILMNMNKQHVTLLVLLDLSSAFDTRSHDILLSRLQSNFGVHGTVLSWFESYLVGRRQRVFINSAIYMFRKVLVSDCFCLTSMQVGYLTL